MYPAAKYVEKGLSLAANGTIRDIGKSNTFDGVAAKLSYDLAQLWPLAQPFVDPTGESIGKIEDLAGKYQKTFTISGSYPSVDAQGRALLFNDFGAAAGFLFDVGSGPYPLPDLDADGALARWREDLDRVRAEAAATASRSVQAGREVRILVRP